MVRFSVIEAVIVLVIFAAFIAGLGYLFGWGFQRAGKR